MKIKRYKGASLEKIREVVLKELGENAVIVNIQKLPGGGVWSVLVLIFGNLLVIFMEGMVAMIQGIRLQYYELFSKYFPGDGTLYQPFTLAEQPLAQDKGGLDA